MAPSRLPLITIFLLVLLGAGCANARKDPAGYYWEIVTDDQPIPKEIESLVPVANSDVHHDVRDYWRIVTNDQPMPKAIQSLVPVADSVHEGVGCDTDDHHKSKRIESSSQPHHQLVDGLPSDKFAKGIESPELVQYVVHAKADDHKFSKGIRSEPQYVVYDKADDHKFAKGIQSEPQYVVYDKADDHKFAKGIRSEPQYVVYDKADDHKFAKGIRSEPQYVVYDKADDHKFAKGIQSEPQYVVYDKADDLPSN